MKNKYVEAISNIEDKFVKYIESYDNKVLSCEYNDDEIVVFAVVNASDYSKEEMQEMKHNVVDLKQTLLYGASVRKLCFDLRINDETKEFNKLSYSYPNHFGAEGLDKVFKNLNAFLVRNVDFYAQDYKNRMEDKYNNIVSQADEFSF